MKVGILLSPYGEARPSGLGVFVKNLTTAILQLNPNWEFYLFTKGSQDMSTFRMFNNASFHALPNTIFWKDIACVKYKEVDIWLYINPSLPFVFAPKKSILTALDFGIFYPDSEAGFREKWKIRFLYFFYSRAMEQVTHVLCTSAATKNDVHRFFQRVPDSKVSVAACGFTRICEVFQPAPVPDLPESFYLMVGVIKPRKNQLTAIEAFILAKDRGLAGKLLISGKGSGKYYESVLKVIAESKYKDDIVLLGYVTSEQLVTLYQKARALIFPSHVEGFGMAQVEAMSCGTPVISTCYGAQGEVANGYAITVDSRDTRGFADAILKFQDETVRNEFVIKGLRRSLDFSWEKCAKIYSSCLSEITRSDYN